MEYMQLWNIWNREGPHVENMVVDVDEFIELLYERQTWRPRHLWYSEQEKTWIFILGTALGLSSLISGIWHSPPVFSRICLKVQNMLPLRLGASSLRVDYDQASRYLQPSFNSNLRKFSFKLRLCSLVYDRLTTAMQCGGMETSLTLSLYHIVSPQQYGGTERQRKEELLQRLFGRTCALCPTFGAGCGKKNIILRKCVYI